MEWEPFNTLITLIGGHSKIITVKFVVFPGHTHLLFLVKFHQVGKEKMLFKVNY